MANQSPDRRRVLAWMAKAAVASQFPGFGRWVFAGEHSHAADHSTGTEKRAPYKAQFFSPEEYRTVDILAEMIIPKDEYPGAHEAGVSEFIDFMAAHGEPELQTAREGLRRLDADARKMSGKEFRDMSGEQQHRLLVAAAAPSADAARHAFFLLMRRYTVMGYYTTRMGLEALDDPDLKLYAKSPACPHLNDPEHLHLPPPRY